MKTVIIIPTNGRNQTLLRRTLTSVLSQCEPCSDLSLVVIENGDHNETEKLVDELNEESNMRISYMFCKIANKSNALNIVLSHSHHDFAIFFDDDCFISHGSISAYISCAERYGHGHYFGGPTRCDYESSVRSRTTNYAPPSTRGWDGHTVCDNILLQGEYFLGFNWAAFTEDIERAGMFNPDFGPGSHSGGTGQETEMQIRLRRLRCIPIYIQEACVRHYIPDSRRTDKWVINRVYRNAISYTCFYLMGYREIAAKVINPSAELMYMALNYLFGVTYRRRFQAKIHHARYLGHIDGRNFFFNHIRKNSES